MKVAAFVVLVLVLFVVVGLGIYFAMPTGGNSCPTCPPRHEGKTSPEGWRWERRTDSQDNLFKDGALVGVWDYPSGSFTEWTGSGFGRVGLECPISPPMPLKTLPTGLVESKISRGKEVITYGGVQIDKEEAFALFEGPCPNCPSPKSGKPAKGKGYVTVIESDQAERAKVRHAWEASPEFAEYRQVLEIWDVPPGHWSLSPGFPSEDHQIILQKADGTVLHRQTSTDTATLLEALRVARPEYDFRKDPNLGGWVDTVKSWAIGLACLLVAIGLLLVFVLIISVMKGRSDP